MLRSAFSCLAFAFLSSLAQADYTLPIPAGPAADSAASNALFPCRSFSDRLTTTGISIADGVIRLSVEWKADSAAKSNAGLRIPLNRRWTPVDFSNVTTISFKYKTSAGTSIEFTPVSEAYTGSLDGVMMLATFGASSTSKPATVSLPNGIDYLPWMAEQYPGDVNFTWDDVKSSIKLLQWAPKASNEAPGNTMASAAFMEISAVTILGLEPPTSMNWVSKLDTRCTHPYQSYHLSDFDGSQPNRNAQGGLWTSYTDQDDPRLIQGASTLREDSASVDRITYLAGDEYPTGLAGITAKLDKGDRNAHSQGGWAGIATGFKDANEEDTDLDMPRLNAISFYLSASDDFDATNLTGVTLKVRHDPSLVADSVPFQASVDVSKFNNQEICLDISQFKQPTWYKSIFTSMPLTKIRKFQWEIKITLDSTKEAAPSSFFIGNVRLYGPSVGISSQKVGSKPALVANYANSLLLSYDLPGASSAKIQVLRLDGSKVAAFDGATKATNQSFTANLAHGTYLAVVQGGGHKLVAPFAVTK